MKDESDKPKDDAAGSWSSPYGPAKPSNGHADGHTAGVSSTASPAAVPPIVPPSAVPPVVPPLGSPVPPSAGAEAYTPLPPASHTADAYPRYEMGAPAPYSSSQQRAPSTALSLMSMIFGILGLALACCYGAGFLFAIAGIIMGHISRSKRAGGRGMSTAGLITGYTGIVISMIAVVYLGTNGFDLRRY